MYNSTSSNVMNLFILKVGASERDTTPRLNALDKQTSLVRTGYSPIYNVGANVHGASAAGMQRESRGVLKMAATT